MEGWKCKRKFNGPTCRCRIRIFIKRWDRDNQFTGYVTGDNFYQFGNTISHDNSFSRLMDQFADETGQRILCNRIVQDNVVDVMFKAGKHRLWREIEVIEIRVIYKIMTIVTTMLPGDIFEFLRLSLVMGVCHTWFLPQFLFDLAFPGIEGPKE